MKIKWIFFNLIIVSALNGCIPETVFLRNEKGDTVKCEGKGDAIHDCIIKYEGTGYKRYEEPQVPPGATEMPISMGGSPY
ncbi:MAG: hypothetical protein ACHQYP_08840 [Nitrospiria bacterium]